jgi:hypothetical protein
MLRITRKEEFLLNVCERKIPFMFKTELEDTRDNGKDSFRSWEEKNFILQEGSKCVCICMFGYFTQYYNYHYYSNCNYYVNSQLIQAIIITF